MTANTGKPFERLVALLFGGITSADLGRTVEIQRNVVLSGKSGRHEIDVFWRLHVGTIFHDVVIQAKDWARPVDQGEVLKFKAVLDDLPNQPRGLMVSRAGFQEGARQIAEAQGILLFTVVPRATPDKFNLEVTTTSTTLLSVVARPAVVAGVDPSEAASGHDLSFKMDTWFAENIQLNFRVGKVPDDADAIVRKMTSGSLGFADLWLVTADGGKQRLSVVIQEYIRKAALADAKEWSDLHRVEGRANLENGAGVTVVRGVQAIELAFTVRHQTLQHPWSEMDKESYILENMLTGTRTVVKVPKDITLQLEQ